MNDSAHIARLLFRYIRKELSPEELTELKTWREADLKNEEFFQVETDPDYIRAAYIRRVQAKEKTFRQLQEKYPVDQKRETKGRVVPMFQISRRAATLITITLIAGSYFFLSKSHHDNSGKMPNAEQTYASIELVDGTIMAMDAFHQGYLAGFAQIRFEKTPGGERVYAASNKPDFVINSMFKLYTGRGGHLILRLPDSSHVWLNEQSTIWYPPNFSDDSIKIIVEGEAYFQQAKFSKKIFSIALPPTAPASRDQLPTKDSMVVSISSGRLNLRSYPDEDSSTITLLKGNALVCVKQNMGKAKASMELLPGQQTIWDGTKFSPPAQVDLKKVMTWEKW